MTVNVVQCPKCKQYVYHGAGSYPPAHVCAECVNQHLALDVLLFGESFKLTRADGTTARIDPRRVRIDPDSTPQEPAE